MSGLSEDASAPLHGDTAAKGAADTPAASVNASILSGLSAVGDLAKIALSVITSLAALMFLALVVVEWRTVRTLVEPLQVPASLADQGLTPEVMSSTLLDRISVITAFDRDRWRPASIAPGWGTTDLNIPLLDISVASLAGLAKTLWGPTDLRVTGEVVAVPGAKDTYTVRLRLKDPTKGWILLTPMVPSTWNSTTDPVEKLFDHVVHDLLLHTDPLSLANHDYVTEVERYRDRSVGLRLRADVCELHQRGEIVEAISQCITTCGAKDKALAYILWGDLLKKASDLRGGDRSLLEDATHKYEAAIAFSDDNGVAYTHWAEALAKLDRGQESSDKHAEAVAAHDDDYLAHYDLAEHLLQVPEDGSVEAPSGTALASAIDHYARSAQLKPDNDWTLTRWGQALLQLKDHKQAEEKFRRAILLNGNNTAARQGLCEAETADPSAGPNPSSCSRATAIRWAQTARSTPSAGGGDHPCAKDALPMTMSRPAR